MSSLLITRAARLDLKKIAAYTQKTWGVTRRRIYLKGLDATFQFLADNPGAGIACNDIVAGLRKHPHEQHVVFYEYQDNTMVVVRVLHRSMDVELHLPDA
ncbi:MAG TPA: type II toxin-antitoxin system RelE/ParE family toxin [Oleiagrimonas sp.]|nr:type II toxin-antitoxin system RelE/ParE family toxin [Oleiagrimonas sp.]